MNNSEYTTNTIQRRKYRVLLFVLFAVVLAIFLCSFWIGYYPLSPLQVVEAFLSKFGYSKEILPQAVTIFWNIRLPRILSAAFIGASLAVAGSSYQGMFRNPLVSPDILGVSSGAGLGAAFAILMGASRFFYGKYGDRIDLDRFMIFSISARKNVRRSCCAGD